jgi:hypothetical protein
MLLKLVGKKIEVARIQPDALLPVVFNLTSWAESPVQLKYWAVDELTHKYLIPIRMGRFWVTADRLLLLMESQEEIYPFLNCILFPTTPGKDHATSLS